MQAKLLERIREYAWRNRSAEKWKRVLYAIEYSASYRTIATKVLRHD